MVRSVLYFLSFLTLVVCNRLTSVSQDFGDLNRLVGVIKRGVIGPVAEEEVGKDMEVGVATKRTGGQVIENCGTHGLYSEGVRVYNFVGC